MLQSYDENNAFNIFSNNLKLRKKQNQNQQQKKDKQQLNSKGSESYKKSDRKQVEADGK